MSREKCMYPVSESHEPVSESSLPGLSCGASMSTLSFDSSGFGLPISVESPAGVNLLDIEEGRRRLSTLRQLRYQARQKEHEAETAGLSEWPVAVEVWSELRDTALDVLLHISRDLGVAAMLIEALCRTNGFIGLAQGFQVVSTMVESHWDQLFSAVEHPGDGQLENACEIKRIWPLLQLIGSLVYEECFLLMPIQQLPLTARIDDKAFGLAHYRSCMNLLHETDDAVVSREVTRGAVSPQMFAMKVLRTNMQTLRKIDEGISSASMSLEIMLYRIEKKSLGAVDSLSMGNPVSQLLNEGSDVVRNAILFHPRP
jgi:type VI secretion system protein ImpA